MAGASGLGLLGRQDLAAAPPVAAVLESSALFHLMEQLMQVRGLRFRVMNPKSLAPRESSQSPCEIAFCSLLSVGGHSDSPELIMLALPGGALSVASSGVQADSRLCP